QRQRDHARLRRRVLPLDEEGALVRAFDDLRGTGFLGQEQADRTAHAEEPGRWHRERTGDDLLDDRATQPERIEALIQHTDEVVLGVAERLRGHRAWISEDIAVAF